MKRILFTLTLLASIAIFNRVQAQCSLSNVVVTLNSANQDVNGNCVVNLDITFDMQDNSGNKYIWINLYKSTDYAFQTFNYGAGGAKGPLLNQIDGANHTHPPVAVIGINNNVSPVAYLASYTPDPTHITPKIGTAISNNPSGNVAHFTLSGISFTVPGACAGMVLQGDVWSTQANSENSPIHCYATGISFFGDPTISGGITCTDPRQFQVILHTVSTSDITTSYKVYLDYPTVGTLDTTGAGGPGHTDTLIYSSSTFTINSTTPYNSGLISYLPYSGRKPSGDQSLLVQVFSSTPSFSKTTYGMLANSCSPLPVSFISFNAKRTNSNNVNLTWQTASESNNSGFSIERNINGSWMQVAFVPSQALGGNSQAVLSYSFTDQNSTSGMSQYRIKQIDIDGKSSYSEIRAVRGMGQSGKMIVYPNPTSNGTVNVVFQEVSASRDISITDMSGRTVQSWKAVTNNNLQINNLTPGLYALRVVDRGTGEQTVEKIVVDKR